MEAPPGNDNTPKVKCKAKHGAIQQKKTFSKMKVAHSSSSSSSTSSDFATPQASPRESRIVHKKVNKAGVGVNVDYEMVSLAYENFKDNPLLDGRQKKTKSAVLKQLTQKPVTVRANSAAASCKPKHIPPRTCLEPIPTPRTLGRRASTASSRDHSRETGKQEDEPHYKSPSRLIEIRERNVYAEPVYQQDTQAPKPSGPSKRSKELSEVVHKSQGAGPQGHQSRSRQQVYETTEQDFPSKLKSNCQEKNKSTSNEPKENQGRNLSQSMPNKLSNNSDNGSKSQSAKQSQQRIRKVQPEQMAFSLKEKEKRRTGKGEKEEQENVRKVLENVSNSLQKGKKKDLAKTEMDDKNQSQGVKHREEISKDDVFANESNEADLVDKTRVVAINGGANPCDTAQKKLTIPLERQKNPADFQPYVPVERKLQPDWFEDLRNKEAKEGIEPRPKSIVDGVLYTSRALAAEEKEQAAGASYSLIDPEVFETYDVCRSHPKAVKVVVE